MVRTALVDAASVSSLMATTECMIVEAVDEKASADAQMRMGGMPGMGGMDY